MFTICTKILTGPIFQTRNPIYLIYLKEITKDQGKEEAIYIKSKDD